MPDFTSAFDKSRTLPRNSNERLVLKAQKTLGVSDISWLMQESFGQNLDF